VFTEYPHQNHASIDSLFNRCKELYEEDPRKAPTIIFIKAGEHVVEGYEREDEDGEMEHHPYLLIQYAMQIIGAGRDKTFLTNGGFDIQHGTKEEGKEVNMREMAMKGACESGLHVCDNGLSFLCTRMTFTQCARCGVVVQSTKGRLVDCVITQCRLNGVHCNNNALIELEGDQTKVDGNVTGGFSNGYGLYTFNTSSIIYLLFPLTKESVSTNNQGGNYGSYHGGTMVGTIQTVSTFAETEATNA
jgi:hypothetical protein